MQAGRCGPKTAASPSRSMQHVHAVFENASAPNSQHVEAQLNFKQLLEIPAHLVHQPVMSSMVSVIRPRSHVHLVQHPVMPSMASFVQPRTHVHLCSAPSHAQHGFHCSALHSCPLCSAPSHVKYGYLCSAPQSCSPCSAPSHVKFGYLCSALHLCSPCSAPSHAQHGHHVHLVQHAHLVQHIVAHVPGQWLLHGLWVHKHWQACKAHHPQLPRPALHCVHLCIRTGWQPFWWKLSLHVFEMPVWCRHLQLSCDYAILHTSGTAQPPNFPTANSPESMQSGFCVGPSRQRPNQPLRGRLLRACQSCIATT